MIRINLLAVERERTKKKIAFPTAQRLTLGCSLLLVLSGGLVGWLTDRVAARGVRANLRRSLDALKDQVEAEVERAPGRQAG